jgi:hypothetical protein
MIFRAMFGPVVARTLPPPATIGCNRIWRGRQDGRLRAALISGSWGIFLFSSGGPLHLTN